MRISDWSSDVSSSDLAETNQRKAEEIIALYRQRQRWIVEVTRSQYGVRALDWMFSRPIFRTSDFVAAADIPRPTANRILRLVRDEGLLRELHPASGRRAAVLGFSELPNIAAGRLVFLGSPMRDKPGCGPPTPNP